jgi:penicillin V acylase-like amidase (Ntn superfamily)
MKRLVIAALTFLVLCITPSFSSACTSFAVYSNNTIYGMNFDYLSDTRLKFTITSGVQGKVFQMGALVSYDYVYLAGMNSKGLFGSCQMLFPEVKPTEETGKNQISPWVFHQIVLLRFEKLSEVKDFLNKKRVVRTVGPTLHNLVADKYGDALVVEAGETENRISRIRGRYIVMTNFPNYQLKDKNYDQADGFGADRFKIAHNYIKSNIEDFNVEKGMETLKQAQNTSERFPTRCSMVFDPDKKEIYISLERDFYRIWKVSLEDQTIETYLGFKAFRREPLPADGLSADELGMW